MSSRNKLIGLLIIGTVLAFLLQSNGPLGKFWEPSDDFPDPEGAQVVFFIILGLVEAFAFGVGLVFITWGFTRVDEVAEALKASRRGVIAAYVATAWILVNWWIHDSLHQTNGLNLNGLLGIEYMFHVTLIISGITVAWFLGQTLHQRLSAATE